MAMPGLNGLFCKILIAVLIFDQTNWKVREAIVVGKQERLNGWLKCSKMQLLREAQEVGKNVTRFTMLNSLEHFNLLQSGCIRCLSVYVSFANNYENFYPNMMDQLILVNSMKTKIKICVILMFVKLIPIILGICFEIAAPRVFDTAMRLVIPSMTPGTKEALRVMLSLIHISEPTRPY